MTETKNNVHAVILFTYCTGRLCVVNLAGTSPICHVAKIRITTVMQQTTVISLKGRIPVTHDSNDRATGMFV